MSGSGSAEDGENFEGSGGGPFGIGRGANFDASDIGMAVVGMVIFQVVHGVGILRTKGVAMEGHLQAKMPA